MSKTREQGFARIPSKDGDDPTANKLENIKKAAALIDESQAGNLPRVVASGKGSFAEQILEIAWANDIKVREDADLAEVLTAIDVESEIPIEAFAAVAEILSYVYKANAGLIEIEDSENLSRNEVLN